MNPKGFQDCVTHGCLSTRSSGTLTSYQPISHTLNYDMYKAPKYDPDSNDQFRGPWILGRTRNGEVRVIRWTTEYPSKGSWMYGYESGEYIDSILTIDPICWMRIPQ
jgi:hypothetical protein